MSCPGGILRDVFFLVSVVVVGCAVCFVPFVVRLGFLGCLFLGRRQLVRVVQKNKNVFPLQAYCCFCYFSDAS